jgi:luciferase family oxidoreductase group 1
MKFGVFSSLQIPRPWAADTESRRFLQAIDQAEVADRLGYDYLWQVEHHFLEEYSHSSAPSSMLAAMSQRTSNIRLGHGVLQLTTNHPIRVAEQVATLDLLSNGRVELGTGEGHGATELHPFGARHRDKRAMWEEGMRALIPCLTEESTSFEGEHWSWEPRTVLPKPQQTPHPPLWVACSSLSTIEMAATRGLGALGFQFATPEGARAWVNRYYNLFQGGVDKLANYQTNPNIAVVSGFMCAETDEEAQAKAEGWTFFVFCLEYNRTNNYAPGTVALWEEYLEWKTSEKAAAVFETGLIGSPDTIRRKLKKFADANLDQIILLTQAGNTSHEDVCSSLELFAREVMPEFHAMEPEHQEWKASVLNGSLSLDDIDTSEHGLIETQLVIGTPDDAVSSGARPGGW